MSYENEYLEKTELHYSGRYIADVYYSITSKRIGMHRYPILIMSIFYDNARVLDYNITLPIKLPLKISKTDKATSVSIARAARDIIESNIINNLSNVGIDKLNVVFCCTCTKTIICSRDVTLLHLRNMRWRVQYYLSSCCNGYEPVRIKDKIKLPFICFGSGNMSSMKIIARAIAEGVK